VEQSSTACMPLLTATSATGRGQRRWSCSWWCYLHVSIPVSVQWLRQMTLDRHWKKTWWDNVKGKTKVLACTERMPRSSRNEGKLSRFTCK